MTDEAARRVQWNERYATEGLVWGLEPNRFVAAELGGLAPRRVLDLGCGQGRHAIWLASQGHEVIGVDLSDVAIAQAQEFAAQAGVEVDFQAHDLSVWEPPSAAFDLVLLSYLQVPEEMRRRVHTMAADAVVPGGRIFLVAHHRDNLERGIGGPQATDVLFDQEQLAADFAGLDIVRNDVVLRPADFGGTSGQAIDVVLVADKPAG